MKKIKKSLAVILAIFMIASFTPLFASAAQVAANKTNCVLVEAPKFKLAGADDSTAVKDLVLPYKAEGYTWSDVAVVGGKITYQDEVVDGVFKVRDTYAATALVIGTQTMTTRIEFVPTDTENFKKATWLSSASSPIANWPSLTVEGLPASISEVPTVGKCVMGARLSTVTITGGKVVNGEGTDVTAEGTWSFVKATTIPSESGNFELQWKSSSYSTLKTTVYVEVKQGYAEVVTPPSYAAVSLGAKQTAVKLTNGTIKDQETGAEITDGTWTVKTKLPYYFYADTPVEVEWKKTGYEPITFNIVVPVNQTNATYNFKKQARLVASEQYLTWSPTQTWENIEIDKAIIEDKEGNVIPGTYKVNQSGVIAVRNSNMHIYIVFTPDDPSLPTCQFRDRILGINPTTFALTPDFEIVIGEGEVTVGDTATNVYISNNNTYKSVIAKSTVTTDPADAGFGSISWPKSQFNPATAKPGDSATVTASVTPISGNYKTMTNLKVKVRIEKRIIDTTFAGEIQIGSRRQYNASVYQQDPLQEIKYEIDFKQPLLKGNVNVNLVAPDGTKTIVNTITPDENGRFYVEDSTFPTVSGRHKVEFEYIPSENDSAEVTGALVLSVDLNIKLLFERTLYVTIGKVTKEYKIMDSYSGLVTVNISNLAEDFPG